MRIISLFALLVLSGCSYLPLFIEDVKEVVEVEQEIMNEIHHNDETILCCYGTCIECDPEVIEFLEKHRDKMKQWEDYYWYHFGQNIRPYNT